MERQVTMPRITRGATSSSSGSCSGESVVDLRLRVRPLTGEWWWLMHHDAEEQWQEKGATLYQVKKGVWVLHRYRPQSPLRRLSSGGRTTQYRLAGKAKQVDARAAADWLLEHNYPLPVELRGFEEEIRAVREQVPDASTATAQPVVKSEQVALFGPGDQPKIGTQRKPPLSRAAYDVVFALIQAGKDGLTKDQLDTQSNHGDARKIMKRLADGDDDWAAVLVFPGKAGRGGYRIQ